MRLGGTRVFLRLIVQRRSTTNSSLYPPSFGRTMSSQPDAFVYLVDPSSGTSANAGEANRLWTSARTSNSKKALDSRIVYEGDTLKTLVSLGSEWSKKKDENARREVVRKAAGTGISKIKDLALSGDVHTVQVDGTLDAHAAGVSSLFSFKSVS